MVRKSHILSLALALLSALPIFGQNEIVCIGSKIVYAANGQIGSTYEYLLEQPEAGVLTKTHNDSILVEWGFTKGTFQLGVREISQFGCFGNWAHLNVQVVGDYAQFTRPVYNMCGGSGVTVDFNKGDFLAHSWVDPTVPANGYITKPGIYELMTIDRNNCRLSSFIEVVQNQTLRVSLGADTVIRTPGFILYANDIQDNPAETVYTWSTGESGVALTSIMVDNHDMNQNSQYWVRAELNGCVMSDTITILAYRSNPLPESFNIPNTFTPNEDGDNDVWNIFTLRNYPDCTVEVFDRWGRRVFTSTKGYSVPWNGRDSMGRRLPMEAYYYIIHLNDGKAKEPLVGTITIIR